MDNDGNIGIEPGTETVYGTHDDNTMVMSEKVLKCKTKQKTTQFKSEYNQAPKSSASRKMRLFPKPYAGKYVQIWTECCFIDFYWHLLAIA